MPDTEPTIQERVLREQVAALYATTASATIADVVVSWAVALLFWWRTDNTMALVWIAVHSSQLLRYPYQAAYFKDPQRDRNVDLWARRHWIEMLWYSGTWALAPWALLPYADVPMTAVLVLIVLGVTSTGIPAVAPRWASVLCFALPMILGLIAALAWQGDTLHLFLALCCLVYLGVSLYIARSQHDMLTQTLLSRFEKEALAAQLEQQIRLTRQASEEKSRFLAAASHDLRQPLHAIGLFGATLERELQGHRAHPHAQHLQQAVQALHRSLGAMLDISRLDAGVVEVQRRPVALRELLLSLHRTFSARALDKGIELRIRSSDLVVSSDPVMLERMLNNLLENALKYTPAGGVLLRVRPRGDHALIEIVDTGIGIDPAQHDLIFQEFYQVDNPSRDRSLGLGIGLSIVRRISLLLDHPVTLRSGLGRGSRFAVRLALAKDAPTQAAPVPGAALSETECGPLPARVLLLDDELIVARGLQALMGTWGVELLCAVDEASARTVLQQAAQEQRPVELILCDMRLGHGVNGLDVARRLLSTTEPAPPLVMITGETAPQRLRELEDSGLPVLFKPVDPQQLRSTLADLHRPATIETRQKPD